MDNIGTILATGGILILGYFVQQRLREKGEKREVAPGYFIEKKNFAKVIGELAEEGKNVFVMDKKGEDIREVENLDNAVFLIGDQDGIPKQEMKRLKNMNVRKVSVGNQMYFASQTLTIIQNELDRRGI